MRGARRITGPLLLVITGLLGLGSGCGDEDQVVAVVELDFVAAIPAREVQAIEVHDPALTLDRAQVLHIGATEIEAASLLVTYDVSALDHPDSAYLLPYLVPENISSAHLYLQYLGWYAPQHSDQWNIVRRPWPGLDKVFTVHELQTPLTAWAAPGPEPAHAPENLCLDTEVQPLPHRSSLELDLAAVNRWLAGRQPIGLIVREGEGSDPGIEGFVGMDFTRLPYYVFGHVQWAAGPSPLLAIRLVERPPQWPDGHTSLVLKPAFDATTWHRIPPDPGPRDDFLLAGQLPRMHVLRFTLPDTLPLDRLYRAQLALTTDPDTSVGPPDNLGCYDVRQAMADSAAARWSLDQLAAVAAWAAALYVQPEHPDTLVLEADVTRVLEGLAPGREHRLAWLLGARDPRLGHCEPWQSSWLGFYYRQVICGPDRPAPAAPRLVLTFRR